MLELLETGGGQGSLRSLVVAAVAGGEGQPPENPGPHGAHFLAGKRA